MFDDRIKTLIELIKIGGVNMNTNRKNIEEIFGPTSEKIISYEDAKQIILDPKMFTENLKTITEQVIKNSPTFDVLLLIVRSPVCDNEIMWKISQVTKNHEVLKTIALETTDPKLLEKFFINQQEILYSRLTTNKHTPDHVLKSLVDYCNSNKIANMKTQLLLFTNIINNINVSNETLYYITSHDAGREYVRKLAVDELQSRGEFDDWPEEWVNSRFNISPIVPIKGWENYV